MIINKLTLENFGLYSGKQVFDLKPKKNKNIILIGGGNGNGKTTFFDAIRLCFYGNKIIEKTYNKKDYHNYLFEKIHDNPNNDDNAMHASVEIEFQYSSMGKSELYNVKRYWEKDSNDKIFELLEIKKDHKPLDIDSDQWQEFINDLIPSGLSQLFFFDGEKIQNLAEDSTDSKQLSDSFNSLLGMDLIEKLQSDLKIYSTKYLKDTSIVDLKKIQDFKECMKDFENNFENNFEEIANIVSKIDSISLNIQKKEELISSEGGSFAAKRHEVLIEKNNIELQIENIENQLRDLSLNKLPFVFSENLNKRLKETLIQEKNITNEKIARLTFLKKFNYIKNKMIKEDNSNLGKKLEFILDEIKIKMGDSLSSNNSTKLVHKISEEDATQIILTVDNIQKHEKVKMIALSKEHEKLSKKRHKLEKNLSFVPDEIVIKPHIEKLRNLNQDFGALNERKNNLEEENNSINIEIEKVKREIEKIEEAVKFKEDLVRRGVLVNKIQSVLKKYYEQFKKLKIDEFSKEFIKSFNFLARKKGVYDKATVDPKTYEVTLHDIKGRKIPKRKLSAGEKQIYAISVLWTLTKLSKRPLPFIIDTPLGRLDVAHRNSFVLNFMPKAGQQLIILSTDTEIDENYSKKLNPYIAKRFLLNFKKGETKITDGYFWKK